MIKLLQGFARMPFAQLEELPSTMNRCPKPRRDAPPVQARPRGEKALVELRGRVEAVEVEILVTPEFHFAHHVADLKIANTNFGAVFTIWDRLFGTYTDPRAVPENAPLGLVYAQSRARLVLGLPLQRPTELA
jgi:hypothetical protein